MRRARTSKHDLSVTLSKTIRTIKWHDTFHWELLATHTTDNNITVQVTCEQDLKFIVVYLCGNAAARLDVDAFEGFPVAQLTGWRCCTHLLLAMDGTTIRITSHVQVAANTHQRHTWMNTRATPINARYSIHATSHTLQRNSAAVSN